MNSLFRGPIHTFGFVSKELISVLRQPRLIASLVLGPFLILLLFGLGYRGQQPEFQTILVLPDDPSFSDDPQLYRQAFAGVFKLRQVTRDERAAREQIQKRQADVAVIVPSDVLGTLAAGQPASVPVLYNETDPTQSAWVRYFAYVQATELNRRILAEILRQSKGPATQALEYASQTQAELDALDGDLRTGNIPNAAARTGRLLVAVRLTREGSGRALDAFGGSAAASGPGSVGQASRALEESEQDLLALQQDLTRGPSGVASAQQRVQRLKAANNRFAALAQQVDRLPPETLVSPFEANAQNVVPTEPTPISYYTPAVLALLLQHIGVTLGALSTVRDRLLGTMELFRVTPVGPVHILAGKSIAYGLLLAVVAAALTAASTAFLGVPSLGDPLFYWLSVGLTIFAAVGLGFALATVASSDSQAVQLSMLILLASVFFGGFFLPLDQLWPQVRPLSYALPVTHGAIDLRDVMLRGEQPLVAHLLGPLALGAAFFLVATVGLRRQLRRI